MRPKGGVAPRKPKKPGAVSFDSAIYDIKRLIWRCSLKILIPCGSTYLLRSSSIGMWIPSGIAKQGFFGLESSDGLQPNSNGLHLRVASSY